MSRGRELQIVYRIWYFCFHRDARAVCESRVSWLGDFYAKYRCALP